MFALFEAGDKTSYIFKQGRPCVNSIFIFFFSQVRVYNISEHKHGPDDVLIMGTDGLWDVTSDREVADAVTKYLSCCEPNDPMRYY